MYRDYLTSLFLKGVERCHPETALPPYFDMAAPLGKTYVIGAGKAAAEMASVAATHLGSDVTGAVVTRYGHGKDEKTGSIEVLYASHPVPDEKSLSAAFQIIGIANQAQKNDRVICLFSGGGSALLTCPAQGISFQDMQGITDRLVKSGAPITDINCVRRHISRVKGGRLANYAVPAEIITYAISDVVGDNPADIASGPTVSAPFEPDRAIAILEEVGYSVSDSLRSAVLNNEIHLNPPSKFHIIAKASDALAAVDLTLSANGWTVINLGGALTGDATDTARAHAKVIEEYLKSEGKTAFVSGGELTVDVKNPNGGGGPNLEYLAALMLALPQDAAYEAIACDSDGIDGSRDNAGGYITGKTFAKCTSISVDPAVMLHRNDTYNLFQALDQLVITGPTGTNVNDIRITLVSPECGQSS